MTTITATYRVATPMFLGGADGTTAELRAPSFKGVLRFWWRAHAWQRLGGEPGRIAAEEAQVFGAPAAGQSRVAVRVTASGAATVRKGEILNVVTDLDGARYLGYGVMETARSRKKGVEAGQLIRGCFKPGFTVTATLRIDPKAEDEVGRIVEALRTLGTVGGLGARSRRGYGSMSIHSIVITDATGNDTEVPAAPDVESLRACLNGLIASTSAGSPAEYTALTGGTQFWLGPPGDDAMKVLNNLGVHYRDFRQELTRDKDVVLKGRPGKVQRVALGLPVNYGEDKPVVRPEHHDRRASPLFFHIHDCGGSAVPVVAYLPARFLPIDENLAIGRRTLPPPSPDDIDKLANSFVRGLAGYREVTRR